MFVDCDYYNVFHGQQKREYPVFEIKTGGAWKKVGNKTHEPQCDYLETRRTRFSGTKTRTHLYISMWISTICARFCSTAWVALCNYCCTFVLFRVSNSSTIHVIRILNCRRKIIPTYVRLNIHATQQT